MKITKEIKRQVFSEMGQESQKRMTKKERVRRAKKMWEWRRKKPVDNFVDSV